MWSKGYFWMPKPPLSSSQTDYPITGQHPDHRGVSSHSTSADTRSFPPHLLALFLNAGEEPPGTASRDPHCVYSRNWDQSDDWSFQESNFWEPNPPLQACRVGAVFFCLFLDSGNFTVEMCFMRLHEARWIPNWFYQHAIRTTQH